MNDWISANLALLNNTGTTQQDLVSDYLNEINDKYDYSDYVTTGHSLGGNLATHATIKAA